MIKNIFCVIWTEKSLFEISFPKGWITQEASGQSTAHVWNSPVESPSKEYACKSNTKLVHAN